MVDEVTIAKALALRRAGAGSGAGGKENHAAAGVRSQAHACPMCGDSIPQALLQKHERKCLQEMAGTDFFA